MRAALDDRCRYTLPALQALVALWPQRWLACIRDAETQIAEGDWVSLNAGGELKIGRVAFAWAPRRGCRALVGL